MNNNVKEAVEEVRKSGSSEVQSYDEVSDKQILIK
jgi:hypothetical protein